MQKIERSTEICRGGSLRNARLRYPTMSKTHIVFEYGGDLWSVPRADGQTRVLVSGIEQPIKVVFAPGGARPSGWPLMRADDRDGQPGLRDSHGRIRYDLDAPALELMRMGWLIRSA
jgi:hypothetical protein